MEKHWNSVMAKPFYQLLAVSLRKAVQVDGNGRMARFAMNALFVSGGYPWTVIHAENRKTYLLSLEKASVEGDITQFVRFIVSEMSLSTGPNF
jgi:hypothetical protein